MKLLCTEVKFYREAKSQTGMSSLRVCFKRALYLHLQETYEHQTRHGGDLLWQASPLNSRNPLTT